MKMLLITFSVLSVAVSGYRFPSSLLHVSQTTKLLFQSRIGALQSSVSDVEPSVIEESSVIEVEGRKAVKELIHLSKSLALNVYVDADIRTFLKMKNSERKARIMFPQEVENVTLQTLRDYVDKKFPSLSGQPYIMRYQQAAMSSPRQFRDDAEALEVIKSAAETAPSLQLYIDGIPGTYPPPLHPYLQEMADPAETETYTMLSFYRFRDITDPTAMSLELQALWKPFKTFGRIYVAKEGVNAQMAVPTNILKEFKSACLTLPLFDDLYLNCDHFISKAEFESTKPFKALHIRVRDQIVADGFSEPLDWQKSGREMSPTDWHRELDNPLSVVLDCRNSYESDVGAFEGAVPLTTTFFRESWDALDESLKGVPKDAPLMTYCTGGIRCVKINAYLEQKLGFTNVSRLAGGIISYTRELEQQNLLAREIQSNGENQDGEGSETNENEGAGISMISSTKSTEAAVANNEIENKEEKEEVIHLSRNILGSKFKGVNYVFDERMGARVTEDILSLCETCGTSSDLFINCNNYQCHVRFIQCMGCRGSYKGCCCKSCQFEHNDFLVASKVPRISTVQVPRIKKTTEEKLMQSMNNKKMFIRKKVMKNVVENDDEHETENEIESNGIFTETNDEIIVAENSEIAEVEVVTETVENTVFEKAVEVPSLSQTEGKEKEIRRKIEREIARVLQEETDEENRGKEMEEKAIALDERTLAVSQYCEKHSSPEPSLLRDLRSVTDSTYPPMAARMLSGPLQGRILSMLASISGAKNVLEIGTFTGYSALCFAEGMAGKNVEKEVVKENREVEEKVEEVVKVESSISPAVIIEMKEEIEGDYLSVRKNRKDEKRQKIIAKIESKKQQLSAKNSLVSSLTRENSAGGSKEEVKGEMTEMIENGGNRGGGRVVTCEVDPSAAVLARTFFDKSEYKDQIEIHVMKGEVFLEKMKTEKRKFDLAFIDADKKMYVTYLQSLMGESTKEQDSKDSEDNEDNCLLEDGALIIADNTLWKGLVLGQVDDLAPSSPPPSLYGDPKRITAIAVAMHAFNVYVREHPRLEVVMFPLRDGLTVIKYNK